MPGSAQMSEPEDEITHLRDTIHRLTAEISQHSGLAWRFTRQGAVTVTIASGPVEVSQ